MIGAPGARGDAGSAHVVFGAATFSETSYQLGSIGAEGSYTLLAPSEGGHGGFSVAGAGERKLVSRNARPCSAVQPAVSDDRIMRSVMSAANRP